MNAIADATTAVATLHREPYDSRTLVVTVDTFSGESIATLVVRLAAQASALDRRSAIVAALASAGFAIADADFPYAVLVSHRFEVEPVLG